MSDVSELINAFFEAHQQIPNDTQYAVVMHADMFYFARAQARTGMFADCQRWLKRDVARRIAVKGFVRIPKPVFHGVQK